MTIRYRRGCLLLFMIGGMVLSCHLRLSAQSTLSSDSLFQLARQAAFDKHDYPLAKQYCHTALQQSPSYTDIRNFLGRIYTWEHQTDSARAVLLEALQGSPSNVETLEALTDLAYWNDRPQEALGYCERGLQVKPGSAALLLKKGRILNDLKRYRESSKVTDTLLAIDPKNEAARSLAQQTHFLAAKNQLGIYYDYVYFDKQFDNPWHLASIDYKRQTSFGPVIARVNYANRFKSSGWQGEIESYPHISRVFYSWVNFGYSHDVGIFPKWRGGFSLYANLPKSFEAEAGFRYLYFSDATWIYTASLGKYYKNFWFNFRTYLTPDNSSISQSYTLTGRYYYGGADDYWTLAVGTGISPDDRSNNIQPFAGVYKLRSNKIAAGYYHSVNKTNVFFVNVTGINQEYLPKTKGNQVDVGVGYQRRF